MGSGYAEPSREGLGTLLDVARLQGALIDPIYTSKELAGMRRIVGAHETVLFLHTGGSPALFAYADHILKALRSRHSR